MSTGSTAANPRANNPQQGGQEATGAVTSDSLAAQSMKEGGGFSENENAHVMGVKGSNSTLNTTDTSGATALHPATDNSTREKQDALAQGSDVKGASGLKYPDAAGQAQFDGVHSSQGYAGGPGNSSSGPNTTTGGTYSGASGDSFAAGGAGLTGSSSGKDSNISSGSAALNQGSGQQGTTSSSTGGNGNSSSGNSSSGQTSSGQTSSGSADTAPNYAASVSGAIHSEGQFKPKGANLTEGGDVPETGTFTGNVGGQYDPGRVAEQTFQKNAADDTISAGAPKHAGSGADSSTGGQYDVLSSERA